MKKIILKEGTQKELEDLVKDADNATKEVSKELIKIKRVFRKLKPHSKVFFLNDTIARLISYANLSPFIITSVLDGIKQIIQTQGPRHISVPKIVNAGYVG